MRQRAMKSDGQLLARALSLSLLQSKNMLSSIFQYSIAYMHLHMLRLDEGEYMAFGLSGDDRKSKMVGGDVTVAWMDKATGKTEQQNI